MDHRCIQTKNATAKLSCGVLWSYTKVEKRQGGRMRLETYSLKKRLCMPGRVSGST